MTTLRSIVVLLLLVLAFLQCTLAVPVSHRDAQPPVKKGHDIHSTSTKRPYKQHSSTSLTLPLPAKLKKAKTKTSLDKGKVHTKVSVSGKGDDESSKYLSNGNKGTDRNNNRHHLSHYGDSKARKGKKTSHVGKKNKKHRKGKHHHRDVDAFSTPDNSEPPALSTGGHEQSSTVRRSFLNLDLGPARGDTESGRFIPRDGGYTQRPCCSSDHRTINRSDITISRSNSAPTRRDRRR
ncbi:hypothetical protein BKA62DRAFT_344982 [Auriculariales sp. MPI-PUGE-AT-0066]|nr:hypothetical protein BKA62DRAFT_344982 [Auriculariales sp. MPI-PUGE-AT-0066]